MAGKNSITKTAAEHVFSLLKSKLPETYVYHNYDRTEEITRACEEIGSGSGLKKSDLEMVVLAGWFLHAGFAEASNGHGEQSAALATDFLRSKGYPDEYIDQVVGCIRAAHPPQNPRNLLEEVLCDAENLHVGKKKYFEKNQLLRVEKENLAGKPLSDLEWLRLSIHALNNSPFHTPYAQQEYGRRRLEHLVRVQEELREALTDQDTATSKRDAQQELLTTKLERAKKPESGVNTMFRVVNRNNMTLNVLADRKAYMMIHTNAIILSITISLLVKNLRETPYLLIPTAILIFCCLLTIVIAIIATRPRILKSQNKEARRADLLFFGNYVGMDINEYEAGMNEMMSKGDFLYGSLIKDTYYIGQVLGRKYKYLRLCYDIFMYGLIISVLAFGIAFYVG